VKDLLSDPDGPTIPAVEAMEKIASTPPAMNPITDVSLVQEVCSQLVPDNRAAGENIAWPKFIPVIIVEKLAPILALLSIVDDESAGPSYVNAAVNVSRVIPKTVTIMLYPNPVPDT